MSASEPSREPFRLARRLRWDRLGTRLVGVRLTHEDGPCLEFRVELPEAAEPAPRPSSPPSRQGRRPKRRRWSGGWPNG